MGDAPTGSLLASMVRRGDALLVAHATADWRRDNNIASGTGLGGLPSIRT